MRGQLYYQPGNLCRWLAEQAEALGVDIFPGFAASELLFDEQGAVKRHTIGDMGVGADGQHKKAASPRHELHGKYTCSPRAAGAIWVNV